MALIPIDPASEEYQQFNRLYQAARALRPSSVDRWNGELYATVGQGKTWGSFHPAGYFKLSQELVFDKLGPGADPQKQVQALVTILHEANHARVEINALEEPNAVLSRHSKALDEGLTEWASVDDVALFADRTGYGELPDPQAAYPAAYAATESLLEYAAGPEGAARLAGRALDVPVVMRWDVIADEIVKNKLGDVVPPDPVHQQAARAELINAMTQPSWKNLDEARADVGEVVARDTSAALDDAARRIRQHYAQHPVQPYPAKTPNHLVAQEQDGQAGGAAGGAPELGGSQERVISRGGEADLRKLPPPAAASRVDRGPHPSRPSGRQDAARPGTSGARAGRTSVEHGQVSTDPSQGDAMRLLSGTAPAAEATHRRPDLGNGARGAGAPAAPALNRPGPDRGTPLSGRGQD